MSANRNPAVGRGGRPQRHAVLRDDSADEGEQPGGARVRRAAGHHSGQRLEGGVVERSAAERHAAADAERPAVGIVEREPELPGLDPHRRREAAVEVDHVGWRRRRSRCSSATRSAPMRTAGARWSSPRAARRRSMWFDSTAASGYTRRSVGTPARSAVPLEHSTNAAAWSTFHCEQCHFVYGAASIGFLASDGCSRNSGVTGSRRHASGFDCRHAAERRPQLGGGARVLGHRLAERRPQRGLERRSTCSGALMKPGGALRLRG